MVCRVCWQYVAAACLAEYAHRVNSNGRNVANLGDLIPERVNKGYIDQLLSFNHVHMAARVCLPCLINTGSNQYRRSVQQLKG